MRVLADLGLQAMKAVEQRGRRMPIGKKTEGLTSITGAEVFRTDQDKSFSFAASQDWVSRLKFHDQFGLC